MQAHVADSYLKSPENLNFKSLHNFYDPSCEQTCNPFLFKSCFLVKQNAQVKVK